MSRSEDFTAGFAALKRVLLTGEALSEQDARRVAGYTDAALFDGFGASEVNCYAYAYVLPGRPMLERLSKALSERLLKEVTQWLNR